MTVYSAVGRFRSCAAVPVLGALSFWILAIHPALAVELFAANKELQSVSRSSERAEATPPPARVERLPLIHPLQRPAAPPVVQPVAFQSPVMQLSSSRLETTQPGEPSRPGLLGPADADFGETYAIDLASALALAGANSLQIRLARERVIESQTNLDEARLMWVPSLRGGIGYNKHDGRIQDTRGDVIEAGRNSLFVGGGAGLGSHPLTGASGGPARFFVDLSLADAAFEPLVARQFLRADRAAVTSTMNNELLAVATSYFDLVETHGRLASARLGLTNAEEMLRLVTAFVQARAMARSEVERARAEQLFWQQQVEDARRRAMTRSAELARLLRLPPSVMLMPVEQRLARMHLVDVTLPIDELIGVGLASRPELAELRALGAAADERVRQEYWRPWLPNLAVGASAGSFGGGQSDTFSDQGSRSDVDALALWELRHGGFGNRVLRRRRSSQLRQACLELALMRDRIASEITAAAADVQSYNRQIDSVLAQTEAAGQSLRLNVLRIRDGEGLPIELQQAIRAYAAAHDAYARAVSDYNRAQSRLLRALGQPPAMAAEN